MPHGHFIQAPIDEPYDPYDPAFIEAEARRLEEIDTELRALKVTSRQPVLPASERHRICEQIWSLTQERNRLEGTP